MATALTSNSFWLTANPRSMPFNTDNNKILKPSALVSFAKQNTPFPAFSAFPALGIPKRSATADDDEPDGADTDGSNKPSRFSFNFRGRIPDAKSLIPALGSSSTALLFANQRRKDPRTVFVAGATGQAGVRIAQTLLRQGFTVRAGVPELASAQDLARLAAKYKVFSPDALKRLNAVESAFEDAESIAKAIGNATKVVVTIGPGENEATSEVTINDALQVIRAAQLAGVGHVAVVFNDSGPGGDVSTYNVLDGITSFFTNLFSKPPTLAEFLSEVVETDVSYTIIKASLTDDFAPENSHGVVVSKEGSTADYNKVSKLQIASLVADVFANTSVAENKVVEVSTSPLVPSKPIVELFSAIPEDGRRKAYEEALSKKKAEEEAIRASEKAREATEAAKKLEEEVKKLSEQEAQAATLAEEARQKAQEAGGSSSLEGLLSKARDFGTGDFSWQKLSSQFATAVSQKNEDEPKKTQIATIRGQAKARTLPSQRAVFKRLTPKPKAMKPEQKPEVKSVFGGLFKQETIYMDDD